MFPLDAKIASFHDGRKCVGMANKRRTSILDHEIDENLRRVYSDVVAAPLPERFTELLDKLREQEREGCENPVEDKQ